MTKAKKYLEKAKNGGFALGAFNAANLETITAVATAAKNLSSPIIIECSPGEIKFLGIQRAVQIVRSFEEELQIPIILNLDHGTDPDEIKKAVDAGFDYVHFDGGKLSLDDAIKQGAELVKYAHNKGVLIEGEIDHIEGSSSDHTKERPDVSSSLYTDPKKAKRFVDGTGVDTFASFVGNLHGIYSENKHLNLDLLREIHNLIPQTYLSLHGGSGIMESDITQAIRSGIVKINVNSEMRIAFKMTLQEVLNASNEIASYKFMEQPINAVVKVVESKIKLFGSSNKV
jgi:fructose-bisphosphate aldolase, class II